MVFALGFSASCSSSPPPREEKDEFFKPIQRKVKSEPSPSSDHQVDALEAEVRILKDSLYRMQNYMLALLQETREQRDQLRELGDALAAANVRFRELNKRFDSWMVDSLKKATDTLKTKIVYLDGRIALYQIFDLMRADKNLYMRIEGHTDNVGITKTNQRLSEQRARAVMGALVRRGMDPQRLMAMGLGPRRPIESNLTAAGRARNSRVELVRR
ncbi:MAG: OmpA/MotB domain protein [Bacteroidetes bacterium]|nr:OmpA/MotB domain protein [Bacteroidota bacterium]